MRFLLGFAFLALCVPPASAQPVLLQIRDGLVTLDATAVPVRTILAEWGKVGGTRIVGAEKIPGAPLTLKLVDVPERQALDIILRNAAGFMAANRAPGATPGASSYDRILILPTSTVSPSTSRASSAPGASSSPRGRPPMRPNVPRPPDQPEPDDNAVEVPEDTADTGVPTQPVFTFPSPPGQMPQQNPVFVPVPADGQAGTVAAPMIRLQPNETGQPTIYNFVPAPATSGPPAATPFGVAAPFGAPAPGMIQQPAPPPAGTKPPPR